MRMCMKRGSRKQEVEIQSALLKDLLTGCPSAVATGTLLPQDDGDGGACVAWAMDVAVQQVSSDREATPIRD